MASLVRVPIQRNPNYKRNGLKSYVYLLNKYSIKPTLRGPYSAGANKLIKQNADGTLGEVTATDQQNDSLYTCPVAIGTPAQTLNLDFDSGSSDLWCWSTELSKSTQSAGKGHTIFDPSKSSTFKTSSGSTWQIQYGDSSSASGTVGTDNIEIGNITVKNQAIELANKLSSQFTQDASSDGLLGLAFGSINTVKPTAVKTPVENMIAQDDIPSSAELFTVYLGSIKDANEESFYTFGQIDESIIPSGSSIAYTPVDNSQGFWTFSSTSASVNGKTIQLSGNTAIADTGTTLLLTSDSVCEAIYGAIPGAKQDTTQQGWVFPADTAESDLPTVTFMVGDTPITIEKEHFAFAGGADGSMVYGGIQSRGDQDFDIFGDTFLQNVYAVFDVGNTRFGVVQRAAPTSTTSTT
ncbi:aspartic peptidase domain-containing protein [Exophiala viscosa]|uniref:aspartic peptidase domain-containing protein n=1 Tax=Exophiala viscosa TaxID=2486360 RepID=UPI0021980798|nr:aspartic peptidase domain-containing protein [Exophiala viscosa]